VPHDIDPKQLVVLVNQLLANDEEDPLPYSFFVDEREVVKELSQMTDDMAINTETVINIKCVTPSSTTSTFSIYPPAHRSLKAVRACACGRRSGRGRGRET